ncbi:MAG: glycosyltransferase family 8 protein [Clostridia bacterium]
MTKTQQLQNTNRNTIIPIFFATDDNYVPFLAVALRSMIDNANKEYQYKIYILNAGLNDTNTKIISDYQRSGFEINFVNVTKMMSGLTDDLDTRDYYTKTTYFRFFIEPMFPQYDKALYLDADIVVLGDISQLYFTEVGDNIIGAIPEQIVASTPEYREYSQTVLGLDYHKYFNAGILVMNLKAFRKAKIEKTFISMIQKYHFDTIAQDQDYLNFIVKDKVTYIDFSWNKECNNYAICEKPNLIHYALFKKPWTYYGMMYDECFWQYAKQTVFFDMLWQRRINHTNEDKQKDELADINLHLRALKICASDYVFSKVVPTNATTFDDNKSLDICFACDIA